ncbi:hypothetical protein WAF17_15285 [Bernardetia sp. ABR2-2B]|uniref:hypothetical protein n=1 Tax=Bernardetia sp. ABR2-2B TaxID=3127472 RepID=UPI0030D38FA1
MKKPINYYIHSLIFCFLLIGCSDSENERAVMWKFQNFDKLTYNFTQKMEISPMGGIFSAFGITNEATGKLTITPTSDEKADVALENLDMGEIGDALLQNMTTDNQKVTEMSIKGLKSDGTIEGKISEAMKLFYTGVLPIPTKNLKVGEMLKVKIKMPIPSSDKKIVMKGFQTLKLKSIKQNLYILQSDILMDEYENPDLEKQIEKEDRPQIKGEGMYTFDIEKGCFTEAKVELKMKMKLDGLEQENSPIKMDFSNMKMNFTSTINLDLEKVE